MASRKTNEAVVAYRALLRAEFERDEAEKRLHGLLNSEQIEMDKYTKMTGEVDKAYEQWQEMTENSAPSTRKQMFSSIVGRAGHDEEAK